MGFLIEITVKIPLSLLKIVVTFSALTVAIYQIPSLFRDIPTHISVVETAH